MQSQIANYMRAGYAGLYIVSFEEQRVEAELKAIANALEYNLFAWSVTNGIAQVSENSGAPDGTVDPIDMLSAFAKLPEKTILLARDFHLFLNNSEPNPLLVRKLKDVLLIGKATSRVFVITGCQLKLPPELEKELTVLEFKLPDRAQLQTVVNGIAQSARLTLNGDTDAILDAASGLTTIEAENCFALSVIETQTISPTVVSREKANSIKKNGILEIIEGTLSLDQIGGLEARKEWLLKRRRAFSREAKAYGLPIPKGELDVGVPGCGKSLGARATATAFGVPLLRWDVGRTFGSLVGESERNARLAIQTAEAISPCVLWIDELEKAFAGTKSSGSSDGGTTARVFGTFLQWLQEKKLPVYVYATANDVSQLPPEFIRKGRWDELWFIDLPDQSEREAIWKIQIAKYGRDPEKYQIDSLARATDGFTGSEIEALFCEALFAAFDQGKEPDELMIAALATETAPLSRTMAKEIESLRLWAQGRARRARAMAPTALGRKLTA